MSKVYVTGDIHGEIDINRISYNNWEESKNLTQNDYLIICGDFGFPFFPTDISDEPLTNKLCRSSRNSYKHWIKWLATRPYNILWCDGNHDNHVFWYNQEVTKWNGGNVHIHPDAPNVIHLMRGEYYIINNTSFWVMGGASSIDKAYRTRNISWWEEELPSNKEYNNAIENLAKYNNKVNYIITHCCSEQIMHNFINYYFKTDELNKFFNNIDKCVEFDHWYFGHYHKDINMDIKHTCVYNKIIQIL